MSPISGVIDVLEEYGDDVAQYVNKYIEVRKGHLGAIEEQDHMFGRKIRNEILLNAIRNEKKQMGKDRDIDDILQKIAVHKSWSTEDMDFLLSVTADDIAKWMQSRPSDLVEKIRDGLLFFGKIQGSDPQETSRNQSIANKAKDALRKVAALNPLNAKRVKNIYRVDI